MNKSWQAFSKKACQLLMIFFLSIYVSVQCLNPSASFSQHNLAILELINRLKQEAHHETSCD